jgi:hypothetical protein
MNGILNEKENKDNIKKDINTFCSEISSLKYTGYVNAPVVIVIYLGDDTFSKVNASIKDAFTTSFSIKPSIYEIRIQADAVSEQIVDTFKDAIKEVSSQGKNFDDIRIAFITLMDDSLYNHDNLCLVDELINAFEELNYYGLDLTKKAIYGLFNQNRMKENYKYAFEFINKGKNLWKNIFHIEIPFVEQSLTTQGQLIALNIIRDNYTMKQDTNNGYRWTSLYLHYLKISEFITCQLLRNIYGHQIDGANIEESDWNKNINNILDQLFHNLLNVNSYECYQYVPLKYQQPIVEKETGFFSLFKKKEEKPVYYSKVLKEDDVIKKLVEQLYGDISLDDQSYSQIIEEIICSATSIDTNSTNIGKHIIRVLNDRVDNINMRLLQLSEKKVSNSNIENIEDYLEDEYKYYQEINMLKKEKEIVEQIVVNISNDLVLKQVIEEIVNKNRKYADVLDELALTEYGGTLDTIKFKELPTFKVNQSVNEILKDIDKHFVNNIVDNKKELLDRLKQFLDHTMFKEVMNKHNLGSINKTFTNIQPIFSYLLLAPNLNNDSQVDSLVHNYENLLKDINDIYRDNSFFVISTRNYDSDQYIINYKRGE